MYEEDEVVQRALTALMRWGIDAHLAYCSERLLLDHIVAGQRAPSSRGKLPYAALLESLLRYGDGRLGYGTHGRGGTAPQVFPGTCPQLAGVFPATWMWARAAIYLYSPPKEEQPPRQLARLCIAVSQLADRGDRSHQRCCATLASASSPRWGRLIVVVSCG